MNLRLLERNLWMITKSLKQLEPYAILSMIFPLGIFVVHATGSNRIIWTKEKKLLVQLDLFFWSWQSIWPHSHLFSRRALIYDYVTMLIQRVCICVIGQK